MAEVRETRLPGVGVRHEFVTEDGNPVGVLVMRDGRRQLLLYGRGDPDACREVLTLSDGDARTLAELLGASRVATEVAAVVQQQIEGLALAWIEIGPHSPMADKTIGDGAFRTNTGCSVVAVIRGTTTVPAPGPNYRFAVGDIAVVVGTDEGLDAVRALVSP